MKKEITMDVMSLFWNVGVDTLTFVIGVALAFEALDELKKGNEHWRRWKNASLVFLGIFVAWLVMAIVG
ncbi:MAG: hypothetical protein SPF51_03325 [Candidatus Fimivicinus sp.]|nr:hypothetical protein [Candidatus Fimivicinus sp.]